MELTCQLANDIDFKKARYPLMGFRKIDGVRAQRFTDVFAGRSLDPFKNTALATRYADPVYAGMDGELTINGWLTDGSAPEGETLCSLTTGLTNRAKLRKGEVELPSNVVWNLFDYLTPDVVDLPYLQRWQALYDWGRAMQPANVFLLPWVWINSETEALAFIDESIDLGFEGAIFRSPDALHKSGRADKKANDFWRFKPSSDKDAIVTAVYEAEENRNVATTNSLGRTERSSHQENKVGKGMAGGFFATDVETGKPIKVPCGCMKHDERILVWQAWLNDPTSIVGRPFKYESLDTGIKDQPRQGRWKEWRAVEDLAPKEVV